jgi:hypothetical protein
MAKRKPEEQDLPPEESREETPPAGAAAGEAPAATGPAKSKWQSRFPEWIDEQAGVRLVEDRQNRRMTIRFAEKPPEAVRKLAKAEYGFKFDFDDEVWYKRIDPAKPRQSRDEAAELAFNAANLIRQEKGLEQKSSFALNA